MHAKSFAATAALASIGIVAAASDPDRPRIYFPRDIRREYFNSTAAPSETVPIATDDGPESSSSGDSLLSQLVSSLLGSQINTISNDPPVDPIVTPAVASTVADRPKGTGAEPNVVVTHTPGKSGHGPVYSPGSSRHDVVQTHEPGPTYRPESSRHTVHETLSSDAAIVIAPTGIVTPSSGPSLRGSGPLIGSRPPTAGELPVTDKRPETPAGHEGGVVPTPSVNGTSARPDEPPAAVPSTKGAILDPVDSLASSLLPAPTTAAASSAPGHVDDTPVPVPTTEGAFTRSTGTGLYSSPPSASSTKPAVLDPVNTLVSPILPATTTTDSLAAPVGTSTGTATGISADDSLTPYSTTRAHGTNSAGTSTDGAVVPAVTSKAGVLDPVVGPVASGLLPGSANSTTFSTDPLSDPTVPPPIAVLPTGTAPTAILSTAVSTDSLSEPTVPTPIAVLPTGTAPTAILSTGVSTDSLLDPTVPTPIAVLPTGTAPTAILSSAVSFPASSSSAKDNATETSGLSSSSAEYSLPATPTPASSDGVLPILSSLLPLSSSTQSSPEIPLNTTIALLPTVTSQSVPVSSDLANATMTTGTGSEVPVATSTTSIETASSPESTVSSAVPTLVPVTNATSSADLTSLSTRPVVNATSSLDSTTLSTGSAVTEPLLTSTASSTVAMPKTSSSRYRLPSSSSVMTDYPSSTPASLRPTTTVASSHTRARPTSSAVPTENKPSSTATPPPSTTSSSASQPSTETSQPVPTSFPKYIAPSKPSFSAPVGTRNITISLNNMVVNNGFEAVSAYNVTSRLLPSLLSLSLASRSAAKIVVFNLEHCDGPPQSANFLAHTSFPDDDGLISQLDTNLGLANSPIYTTNGAALTEVIEKNLEAAGLEMYPTDTQDAVKLRNNIERFHNITIERCATRGSGTTVGSGGDPGSNGDGGNPPNPGNQSEKEKLTTMGVAFGVVGAGFMYGAAMFIIARRYKRKRQAHRRSSSVSDSQVSSEMRYAEGASPALMGGALPSRDYSNYGAEGRESHGSGRSGMGNSGRTANISAPVAAENSLGWN